MSSQRHWYSSQRAIDELGYRLRPADESIRDAIAWFRENQYLWNELRRYLRSRLRFRQVVH